MPDQCCKALSQYTIDNQLPVTLVEWYRKCARDLPWRHDRAPYHVWISEIMLQQTRVEAVKAYYLRFLEALPTIAALAEADEGQLLKLWEGLGYYSRARNLQKAAQTIMRDYAGIFPQAFEDIVKLPGIGQYTAGAIASICYDMRTPAVDGNVLRVMARVLEFSDDVSLPKTKAGLTQALRQVYPAQGSGDFTQSLMELGATVCLPNGKPLCGVCPVAFLCKAHQNGTAVGLPVKAKKKARTQRDITVLILQCEGEIALRKREDKGLLAGMWELPNAAQKLDSAQAEALAAEWGAQPVRVAEAAGYTHAFTHVEWHVTVYRVDCGSKSGWFIWSGADALERDYALPAAFKKAFGGDHKRPSARTG